MLASAVELSRLQLRLANVSASSMTLANLVRAELSRSSFVLISALALIAFLAYTVALAVYRLYLSPLAKFPGPKLAALSQYYETYYELISGGGGNFTRRIKKMHDTYGMSMKPLLFTVRLSHIPKVQSYALIPGRFTSMIRNTTKPYMPRRRLIAS